MHYQRALRDEESAARYKRLVAPWDADIGVVTHDKKQLIEWDDHRRTPLYELKKRTLAQDTMILGALRCAKANGFTGEEG